MKLSAKNTARVAVTAGLCASLALGGLPMGAIAAELDVVEQGAGVEEIVEQDLVSGGGASADGQGVTAPAGSAEDDLTTGGEKAPVEGDELDDEVLAGDPEDDDVDAADAGAVAAAVALDADEPAPAEDVAERAVKLAGNGTAQDPFIVASVDDLKVLAKSVNEGTTYKGQLIKVADGATFDLSTEAWSPIGTEDHKFMGTFDGNGVTIKGLRDSADHAVFGLFGHVDGAQLKNVTFTDINLTATPTLGEDEKSFKGALVGLAYGACTIDNVTVSGGKVLGYGAAGAVLGGLNIPEGSAVQFTVSGCSNSASVSGSGHIGGIMGAAVPQGYQSSKVYFKNCANSGNVESTDGTAGGIVGYARVANHSNCSNKGDVKAFTFGGGIVGNQEWKGSVIEGCTNSGAISGGRTAGGIMGLSSSGNNTIGGCANTGDVTAGPTPDKEDWGDFGGPKAGGIAGGSRAAGDNYTNCYNSGSITVTGEKATAGGIFGHYTTSSVKACFNEGDLSVPEGGTILQIGKSTSSNLVTPGQTIEGCYYKDGDSFVASSATGTAAGDTTYTDRGDLVDALNEAGGVPGFWQAQNGSVQPDALIPGAWDENEKAVVVKTYDASGNHRESYPSLEAAIAGVKNGETIKLVKDVDVSNATEEFAIAAGVNATLDLNGYTLCAANNGLFRVYGSLTIQDSTDTAKDGTGKGKILAVKKYSEGATAGIIAVHAGGSLVMESGFIDCASKFAGNNASEGQFGISLWNDTADASVTMNGGKISAGWYAITGNGNNVDHDGTITVNGGILESAVDYAIYSPQAGGVVVNGGVVKGAAGAVHIQRGELTVAGGELTSTGTGNTGSWGDGTSGSGNAVVNFAGKYGPVASTVTGGTFVAEGNAEMFHVGDKYPADIAVSGGTFNTEVPEAYLAEGFGLNKLPGGGYGVHEHEMVMKSDEKGHWTECATEGCAEKTDVVKHDKGELKAAKDATCTEDGYTGDLTCTECGYVIKKGEVIKALGHDWSKWSVTEPTCTKDGEKTRTCSACGEKETEAIKATGHTAAKWEGSSTDHWKVCETCGEEFANEAHEFGEWKVTKEPTATEKGEREHACKVCGKTVSEEIPALGEKPADKPADKGDKPGLPGTGDASLFGVTATGIAGALAAAAGAITRRRRK